MLYVPEQARYRNLLNLPEGENIGQAINEAMKAVEAENEDLKDALPKIYNRLDNDRNLLPPPPYLGRIGGLADERNLQCLLR